MKCALQLCRTRLKCRRHPADVGSKLLGLLAPSRWQISNHSCETVIHTGIPVGSTSYRLKDALPYTGSWVAWGSLRPLARDRLLVPRSQERWRVRMRAKED